MEQNIEMKKIRYVLILLILLSCETKHSQETRSLPDPESEMEEISGALPGNSVYNISSGWVDEMGNGLILTDLRGKIVIVSMIYTSCKFSCPRTIEDLKKIEQRLEKQKGIEPMFLLITMDPEKDTPEKLAEFASNNNMKQERWKLITSDDGAIREMAAVLGMRYKKIDAMDFAHSNIITVLNRQGRIVHQQEGLGVDPALITKVIVDQVSAKGN
jgi:protein SCO1